MLSLIHAVIDDPAFQTGIQGVGAAGVFYVIGKLQDIGRRLDRIEKKLRL